MHSLSDFQELSRQLTVVITLFDGEQDAQTALKNIANLCEQGFSVIVIDDASPSRAVVELLLGLNIEEIEIIELKKNVGPAEARNIGLMHVRTKYVWFCDFDDEFGVYDIELYSELKRMENLYADAAIFNFFWIQTLDSKLPAKILHKCKKLDNSPFFNECELQTIAYWPLGIWRMIFRTEFLTKNAIFWGPTYRELGHGKRFLEDAFIFAKFRAYNPRVIKCKSEEAIYGYKVKSSYSTRSLGEDGCEIMFCRVVLNEIHINNAPNPKSMYKLFVKVLWTPTPSIRSNKLRVGLQRLRLSWEALSLANEMRYSLAKKIGLEIVNHSHAVAKGLVYRWINPNSEKPNIESFVWHKLLNDLLEPKK